MKRKLFIITMFIGIFAMCQTPRVARVIYSEASPICTGGERHKIASVIRNRVGNRAFGGYGSMFEVVSAEGQFKSLNDPNNSNWTASAEPLDNRAWRQAMLLASGRFTPYPDIVYFHDKSAEKPESWDNQWWRAVKVVETRHFIFYKVVPAKTGKEVSSASAEARQG